MKIRRQLRTTNDRGMLLVDCLIYLAVTALLVGLGVALYLRCLDAASGLSRNADDIAEATALGERWREDLRLAVAPPFHDETGGSSLVIPQAVGETVYRFGYDSVWRKAADSREWARLLDRVVRAEWNPEVREHVVAWHLDLEMKSKKRNARVRPLFSFIGVAGATTAPAPASHQP
jgi:hypothetical protein